MYHKSLTVGVLPVTLEVLHLTLGDIPLVAGVIPLIEGVVPLTESAILFIVGDIPQTEGDIFLLPGHRRCKCISPKDTHCDFVGKLMVTTSTHLPPRPL